MIKWFIICAYFIVLISCGIDWYKNYCKDCVKRCIFFSLNDLGIGLTIPIKLKNIIERPRTGQPLAFNKLAEILSSNFVKKKQSNKENRSEKSQKHTFIIR